MTNNKSVACRSRGERTSSYNSSDEAIIVRKSSLLLHRRYMLTTTGSIVFPVPLLRCRDKLSSRSVMVALLVDLSQAAAAATFLSFYLAPITIYDLILARLQSYLLVLVATIRRTKFRSLFWSTVARKHAGDFYIECARNFCPPIFFFF